jgi:hypothetical protein
MDLFLRNKLKLDNCRFGETSKNQQFQLAKNPQLEKLFFENFKKIENLGSTPNPSSMHNREEAKRHVQQDKKNRRWTVFNGDI